MGWLSETIEANSNQMLSRKPLHIIFRPGFSPAVVLILSCSGSGLGLDLNMTYFRV